MVSAIYLPSSITAASLFGFPVACGMVVFAGTCEVGIAWLVNKMRKLFPAVVSGVVICAVAIELGKIGIGALVEAAVANEARGQRMFITAL